MTAEEALRYLAAIGVEYASTFGEMKRPMAQQAILASVNAAAEVLRREIATHARPQG